MRPSTDKPDRGPPAHSRACWNDKTRWRNAVNAAQPALIEQHVELEVGTVKTRLHRAHSMLRDRLYRNIDRAAIDAFPFGVERCDRIVAAVLHRLVRDGS